MTNDLVFTKDKFKFEPIQEKKFRNYLRIATPEIVNMPEIGFDPAIIEAMDYSYSTNSAGNSQDEFKAKFLRDSIIRGAAEYNIVVNSYSAKLIENGTLNVDQVTFS